MVINNITVKNFRKFEQQSFSLNNRFNVLIGDNASGKTLLLDAISIIISSYLLDMGTKSARHIVKDDIRLTTEKHYDLVSVTEVFPVSITANISLKDKQYIVTRELKSSPGRTTWVDAKSLKDVGMTDKKTIAAQSSVDLPLLAYYGTGRLWHTKRHNEKVKLQSRLFGYRNCLDPQSDHIEFTKWFHQQELVTIQKRITVPALEAVRNAVIRSIPDCLNIYFDMQYLKLVMQLKGEVFCPFDNLSAGFKNMVAMVADIAYRASRLNPQFGDEVLNKTGGVVLIDEIDLHLHPKWQRHVVEDLKKIFPQIQFIATTHSPFIIQSMDRGEVIDMNSIELEASETMVKEDCFNIAAPPPTAEYTNRSVEDIVEDIMGIELPQRSKRLRDMYDTAKEYYRILEQAGTVDEKKKEELKHTLDELSAPFSDNVAYFAFLEMERLAKGLGTSKK